MESDPKRIRLDGLSQEEIENQAAMLLLLPPEIRAKIIIQISDFADIMKLKNVSSDLRKWINDDKSIVLRWERKHLHSNDFWRSYLMQKFAFGDYVKVSLGNGEFLQVNFDSLFRNQHREVFDEEIDDELDSLKDEFELTMICKPQVDSPLLSTYDAFFQTDTHRYFFTVLNLIGGDQIFNFGVRGADIYIYRIGTTIAVTTFILNLRKRRIFDFIMHLMERFKYATFQEEADIGRRQLRLRANITNA